MFEISLSNAAELIASIRIHVSCRNLNIRAEQPFIPASVLTTHLTLFENAMKLNHRNRIPMNKQRPILLFVILALAATTPFSIAQQSQGDAEAPMRAKPQPLARFRHSILDGEEEEFPPHAVSLKTPEEIMAIYKAGEPGRSYAAGADALSFPKQADGICASWGRSQLYCARPQNLASYHPGRWFRAAP